MANGHGGTRAGAGRKPRSATQPLRHTAEALRAYCAAKQVDPFRFLVDLMADTSAPIEQRFQAAKELAPYLLPKLKAVDMELSGNADAPLTIVIRRRDA